MKKRKHNMPKGVEIGIGDRESFFARGREIARRADAGERIGESFRVTFEDPLELARFLTPARVRLLREIRHREDSVSGLARRLRRDPSAVRRDIGALEKNGLVTRATAINPGHGRMVVIRPASEHPILFEARL